MSYGAPTVVESQPRVGLPFGLFSTLTLRESSDSHWENGIEWEALACDPASGISDPGCETEIEKFFSNNGVPIGEATPFHVYGTSKCNPVGSGLDRGQERATANLLAREEGQAEIQVWNRLASAATDINPAGPLDPVPALAALERWLGAVYGSLGVIHMDRGVALSVGEYLDKSGSRLLTKVGTPVIAGGGYPGTSPTGAAPAAGESWVFASPALFGYRGQVFDSSNRRGDLLDRTKNDLYAVAERTYVVGYDPCGVAAVRVNIA